MAAKSLFDVELSTLPVILAGHSVGEITAASLAGVLTESEAMTFVRERANSMAAAAAATPTGMSAVVGGDPADVLAAIEASGATAANVNGAGQTVAAGTLEQLKALAENPPAKARVIPLKVAGAFHTSHMAPAAAALQALRPSLHPPEPAGAAAVQLRRRGSHRRRRRRRQPDCPGLPPGPLGPLHGARWCSAA